MISSTSVQKVEQITIKWEDFQREYLQREDEYKYEWVDGKVEKSLHSMNPNQLFILVNIKKFLESIYPNGDAGLFVAETDLMFAGNHRRPDITFLTYDQIEAARQDLEITPQFVIEVISTNDQINVAYRKLRNYRAAEVAVVWYIFPELKEVHVYRGKQSEICLEDDICSAEPVIEGFKMQAKDVFK
ncbi:MAG: Uma2 family endonuclease [Bacteroidota bacterium]